MINVPIDPFALAYPNSESTKQEDFEDYIIRILELKELQDEMNINYFISEKTSLILNETNNYPHWDDLKEALVSQGLSEFYQAKDIITTLDTILNNPTIEEMLSIQEILYDKININPKDYTDSYSEQYLDELYRLLMYICLAIEDGQEIFLLSMYKKNNVIRVQGELLEIEANTVTRTLPVNLNEEITIFNGANNLFSILDLCSLWQKSSTENEYNSCLEIGIYKRNNSRLEKRNWVIGKNFIDSMKSLGFAHDRSKIKSLLKSMIETIVYENLSATHALRMTESGNSSQIMRGKEKGMRRDIDYEYHLHYWDSGGSIEFSNVVVHNDFDITR